MKAYTKTVTGVRPQQRGVAAGDLLTIREALAILPVGRSSLYSLVARGALPSYRVSAAGSGPGRIFVTRADLEAFIEKSRAGGMA